MFARSLVAIIVALVFVAMGMRPALAVDPDFGFRRNFGTGSNTSPALAVGDLDGDGDLDIVTSNVVHINDGNGIFDAVRNFGTSVDATRSVALGDMDGDGDLDIVTGNAGQDVVYLNDGAANFETARNFGTGVDITESVAIGDMDGDGDLDIVTGNSLIIFGEQNVVYLNDGYGNFENARNFGTGFDITYSVAVGDMDGDHDLDIVTGNMGEQSVVYINDGYGNFATAHNFGTVSDTSQSVALGDTDSDGDLDIVTRNGVYLNDSTGHFAAARSFGTGVGPVAVSDMDGDGDVDIVAGNTAQQSVIYLNDGYGNFATLRSFGPASERTPSVAVGDIDGDGHLDIITGNYVIYINNGAGNFDAVHNFGTGMDRTKSIAVGDMDGDGDLDIVTGNTDQQNVVYLNDGTGNFAIARPFGTGSHYTESVAVGDMDGDGDLDIVAGNNAAVFGEQSAVYFNDGNGNFDAARNFGTSVDATRSVALGDMDGDGDLDIVTANTGTDALLGDVGQQSFVYLNDGNGTFDIEHRFGTSSDITLCLVVGDMDGDGDLDIVTSNGVYHNAGDGNFAAVRSFDTPVDNAASVAVGDLDGNGDLDIITGNGIYLNDSDGSFAVARSFGARSDNTKSVAVGDIDSDGDLDIVTGNIGQQNMVYLNNAAGNFLTPRNFGSGADNTFSVATGDMDGDGDLDIIAGNDNEQNAVYSNEIANSLQTIRSRFFRPISTPNANFFSTPVLIAGQQIGLRYRLFEARSRLVGRVKVQYSLDGGGHWLPAIPTLGTQTTNLASSPSGTEHDFRWDTFGSGFFGQSDNVVLRLLIFPQPDEPAAPGTYRYVNTVAGSYQHGIVATQTFPFRVRGTQVFVEQDGQRRAAALVYRLPAGAERGGQLMRGPSGPYRTDNQGYMQGRGQLGVGDRLVALLPISYTAAYDAYYTTPVDPATGLPGFTVSQAGVQTLTVSSANPLVLFNLDMALEWDASKDTAYLAQLQYDLNRTSELLYDWSDGQAALGHIRIYHDARRQPFVRRDQRDMPCDPLAETGCYQPWLNGHIRIYASNEVHPNAIQGGIVGDRTEETAPTGKQVVYTPGMVHIGSVWNRYADSSTLGEDWPRALAHELGHYLFFLDDNYIGQAADGSVQFISSDPITGCPGAMNDPYTDFLTKYQPQPSWLPGCAGTYSQQTLGRSDWETIVAHYPWLHAPTVPIKDVNPGPSGQRLAFTQFEVVLPPAPVPADRQTLSLPIFTISTTDGSGYRPSPDAHAFLLQDTRLIELGAPSLDQVVARGARQGDTLCLLEPDIQRAGCVAITPGSDQLVVQSVPDWQPQVIFTPVTSRTLTVQVAGLAGGIALKAQLYPRDGDATVAIDLPPAGSGYAGTFDLPEPVFEGSLRVWDANNPLRQVIADFVLGSNPTRWDSRDARWRARLARWRARLAPVISSGGKVAVLGDNVDFGSEDWVFSLQAATALPGLPTWATPIGQGYWLHASANAPSLANTAISFNYDRRDVPAGQEDVLHVFFWNAGAWTPLTTTINADQGIASAPTQGPGLYALVAAREIPLQGPGWNNFAYAVVGDPTPVGQALNSIVGYYSIVYSYEPTNQTDPWRAFDPTAPDWANDLDFLEYGKAYWLYVEPIRHPVSGSGCCCAGCSSHDGGRLSLAIPATRYCLRRHTRAGGYGRHRLDRRQTVRPGKDQDSRQRRRHSRFCARRRRRSWRRGLRSGRARD